MRMMKRDDVILVIIMSLLIAGWGHNFNVTSETFDVGYQIKATTGEMASFAEISEYDTTLERYDFQGKSNVSIFLPLSVRSKIEKFYKIDYPNETSLCLPTKRLSNILYVKDAVRAKTTEQTPFNTSGSSCLPPAIHIHSHTAGYCLPSPDDLKSAYFSRSIFGVICRNDGLGFRPDGTIYLNDTYQRMFFYVWD